MVTDVIRNETGIASHGNGVNFTKFLVGEHSTFNRFFEGFKIGTGALMGFGIGRFTEVLEIAVLFAVGD